MIITSARVVVVAKLVGKAWYVSREYGSPVGTLQMRCSKVKGQWIVVSECNVCD
jgi:hypothetical protein